MNVNVKTLSITAAALALVSGCSEREETTDRLVVWSTESDANAGKVMDRLEAEFEAKHPGVDLVIETVGWGDLSERLINASHSGAWPDVSHVQPFMVASLHARGDLLPITDVRDAIEEENGPIFPAVRELQQLRNEEGDEEVYGIAYAVGTTFWSVRSDQIPSDAELSEIDTWSEYLELMSPATEEVEGADRATLPGASPFFMDQLFSELVVNAGGNLFDENQCPLLTSEPVIETLQFFQALNQSGLLAEDWSSQTYSDQFQKLAEGRVASVPVTYARAAQTITDYHDRDPDAEGKADDKTYVWLDQPTSREGLTSIGTIDAEPWVIFAKAENRQQEKGGANNAELAKSFLRMFYSREFYPEYTQQVPVQLTPIFSNLASDPSYVQTTQPFGTWHERTIQRLNDDSTRPILMTDISETGRNLPFLLEFQRAGILSRAIADVIQADVSPVEAAAGAQRSTIQLVRRSSNVVCEE